MYVLTFIKLCCIAELSHAVATQGSIRIFADLADSGSLTSCVVDFFNWVTEGKVESTRCGSGVKAKKSSGTSTTADIVSRPKFLPRLC